MGLPLLRMNARKLANLRIPKGEPLKLAVNACARAAGAEIRSSRM